MHAAIVLEGSRASANAEVHMTASRAITVMQPILPVARPLAVSSEAAPVVSAFATPNEPTTSSVLRSRASDTVSSEAADDYLAANLLSERPVPHENVVVTYPESSDERGVFKVVLTLFVNELGTIDRIAVDDPELPAPFANAAMDAFSRVTFSPGLIADRAVKSRVRIEIIFDNESPHD